jgi:hypothetical protein
VLFVQVEGYVVSSGNIGLCYFNPCIIASGIAYCDFQLGGTNHEALFRQYLNVSLIEDEKTKTKTISISAATDSFRQMNVENKTYHWIVLG